MSADRPTSTPLPEKAIASFATAMRSSGMTAGAQTFSERSLRDQLHFEFAGEELARELVVGADVGARGATDSMWSDSCEKS